MEKLHALKNYIGYKWKAGNAHGLHSPFVFDLFNSVINDQTPFYGFEAIEMLRSKLLTSKESISILDLGAGGTKNQEEKRTVSSLATNSLTPAKYGQLLFRLANYFKPKVILELGTAFGISTLYLSMPSNETRVITIEGATRIFEEAKKNFARMNRQNITAINAPFESALPSLLSSEEKPDFIYFDGNHRYTPTMDYFHQCLAIADANSIFIFDDIYWSKEMTKAWEEIKAHPEVVLTIDLFKLGLVFFKKGIPKQDFVLQL